MSTGEDQSDEKNELRLRESPTFKPQGEEEEEEESSKENENREEGAKPENAISQKSMGRYSQKERNPQLCGMQLSGQIRCWLKKIHQFGLHRVY